MSNAPLRGCPTCGTKVTDLALGPRDFRWVSESLPGKVAPMDVDFILERKGHFLILELKPMGGYVGVGQGRTLRALKKFADVWVVYGEGPQVEVDFGDGERHPMALSFLASEINQWFEEASA